MKNWFHHLPKQNSTNQERRPARFYLLTAYFNAGQRSASLAPLDPLLERYESEYHYLFKRVHEEAHRGDAEVMLEDYYGMPNLARRLVETFLAFRYPDRQGDLAKQIEEVDFDSGKKTRILRFCIPTLTPGASLILSTTPRFYPKRGLFCASFWN